MKFKAATRHTDHPHLHVRMQLLSRVLIALHLRMHPDPRAADHDALHEVVRGARHAADRRYPPDTLKGDRHHLSEHLEHVRETTLVEAGRFALTQSQRLKAFDSHIRDIRCSACAAHAQQPACTGLPLDQQPALVGAGHCWAPFIELFEDLVTLASQTYGSLVALQGRHLEIKFSTQVTDGHVSGCTEFPPDDSLANRTCTVVIDLPDEGLDERAVGRLPYIMLHEIFVHAPESWGAALQREPKGDANAFTEGFMDRAAYLTLEAFLQGGGRFQKPFDEAFDWFLAEGEQAHVARYALDVAPKRLSYASNLRTGRQVFDRLRRSLPLTRAAEFAARLNALPLTRKQQCDLLMMLDLAAAALDGNASEQSDIAVDVSAPLVSNSSRWIGFRGELAAALERDDGALMAIIDKAALDAGDF